MRTRYIESMDSPLLRRDAGVSTIGEKLEVEGCPSQAGDPWHIVYVFRPPHVNKDDPSGNIFLRTEDLCPVMIKDKSKILSILGDPGIVCCILLRPDDALSWAATEERDKGLRNLENLPC